MILGKTMVVDLVLLDDLLVKNPDYFDPLTTELGDRPLNTILADDVRFMESAEEISKSVNSSLLDLSQSRSADIGN